MLELVTWAGSGSLIGVYVFSDTWMFTVYMECDFNFKIE